MKGGSKTSAAHTDFARKNMPVWLHVMKRKRHEQHGVTFAARMASPPKGPKRVYPPTPKEMTRHIGDMTSPTQLQPLLQKHPGRVGHIQLTAAVAQAAWLLREGKAEQSQVHVLLDQLTDSVFHSLESMDIRGLASIVWCMGRARFTPNPVFLQALTETLLADSSSSTGNDSPHLSAHKRLTLRRAVEENLKRSVIKERSDAAGMGFGDIIGSSSTINTTPASCANSSSANSKVAVQGKEEVGAEYPSGSSGGAGRGSAGACGGGAAVEGKR
ncbi:MAG: hypothetical protein WDW38_010367 [Sanguina aurantia]